MWKNTSARRPAGGRLVAVLFALGLAVAASLAVVIMMRWQATPGPGKVEADAGVNGKELYANYCLQCHGEKGDGEGPAARYLYPKPRDFTAAKFKIVTGSKRNPTDEDLFQVVTRGMPGSAMVPFGHLSEEERKALVGHVHALTRAGLEAKFREEANRTHQPLSDAELKEAVDLWMNPGDRIQIPADAPAATEASVAHGRERYLAVCATCHGTTGKGDGAQVMKDDNGMPTRPRDFTRGVFKGGRDPLNLRARIQLGMPGSAMPASADMPSAEMGDIVNFILTLSDAAAQKKVEHQRTTITAARASAALADDIPEAAWAAAPAVSMVVTPIWWREYPEPDLRVQAIHDGKTVAVRLSWADATRDDRTVRPQDFEDMAAVQLFRGAVEPFLGMGASDRSVDIWLWRASWTTGTNKAGDLAAVYPNAAVDFYPLEKEKEFLPAKAVGNLNADSAAGFSGSNLQAKGFGTATMRPRANQAVKASGSWKDGHWTVVLRRPLAGGDDGGLPLAAGDKVSIAFAIWDGAARDRNGQKLISIWHDLKLE